MFFSTSQPALRATSLSWPVQRFLASRRCGTYRRLHLNQLSLSRLPEKPSVTQLARLVLDISVFGFGVGFGLALSSYSVSSVLGKRPIEFVGESSLGASFSFVRSEYGDVLIAPKSERKLGEGYKAIRGGFLFACHCRRAET